MARRTPGAVRAEPTRTRHRQPATQITGISRRAQTAIEIADARHLWSGGVGQALDRYRRFLRRPGRWLYFPWPDCPCCDPVEARDELETALHVLPAGPRRELRRIIAPLDAEFRRRTLPNPTAYSDDRIVSGGRANC